MPELTTDDGVTVHYVVHGNGGRAVVYLHCMGGDTETWRGVWAHLDSDTYRHVAFDFRGHGKSVHEPCELTNERLSRDAPQMADALGIDRFAVVGHSLGGKVGMRLAAMAPERVAGLALLGSPGPGLVPFKREDVAEFMATYHDLAVTRAFFRPWFKVDLAHPAVDALMRSFAALPDWALHATAEISLWTDLTPVVSRIELPSLVVAGADDPQYGPAYQRDAVLPWLPRAKFAVVPECGHGLIVERPAEVAALLAPFLAGVLGRRS